MSAPTTALQVTRRSRRPLAGRLSRAALLGRGDWRIAVSVQRRGALGLVTEDRAHHGGRAEVTTLEAVSADRSTAESTETAVVPVVANRPAPGIGDYELVNPGRTRECVENSDGSAPVVY